MVVSETLELAKTYQRSPKGRLFDRYRAW